jgi:hypothetical protein
MRIRIAVPERHVHPAVIDAAMEAVTRLDEHMIRSGDAPPWSPDLGVRWRPENFGEEHFDHAVEALQRGWADCDDLASWKAGSLRATGEDPGATARVVPSGPSMYHAIVQRSDGSIDDPSVEAGMKATRTGSINGETIEIMACDPHDGRIYQGSLVPTVGPLAMHCGPAVAVRPAGISGLWEGRCDVPLSGSPLLRVRSYKRHRPHHRHQHSHHPGRVAGVPYALSCTHYAPTASHALSGAIVGAVLCGDAAEIAIPMDRYKLLAIQGLLGGLHPQEVTERLAGHIHQDGTTSVVGGGSHDPRTAAHGIVSSVVGAVANLPC